MVRLKYRNGPIYTVSIKQSKINFKNFKTQLTDKQLCKFEFLKLSQTYQYFQTDISLVASFVKTWLQCSS